ncbi:DUF6612 family protein [Natribacillus halophilus]|uniref:YusW-like protein n=1 Tax=Natribacillus halophilus TaxID=549003 RepID=A0A1G8QAT5_9BACI|nr:DUF6612 family protein [Natribacillus halophilus]SDJ01914.1 hypothetical protein SAMN04488123_11153 [Natribacillus halophilus]
MTKMKGFLTASAAMLMLAACGDEDADTEEVAEDSEEENEAAEETEDTEAADENGMDEGTEETEEADATEEEMDAEEVLSESMEAMDQLNSYSAEMDMDQTISVDGEEMPMDMTMNMDVVLDPMSFSQTMITPDPMTEEEMEIEQYMDEDGTIYMLDPEMDEWIMMDGSDLGLENIEDLEMSPQEQLEMMETFASDLNMEEEEDRYALSIEGFGDEFMELIQEFAAMGDPQMQEEMDQFLGQMDINALDYVIYIDKETFYQDEIEMNMELEMEEGGQSMEMSQKMQGTFSDFDETDEIDIPEEAIDEAIDIEDLEEEMEEPAEDDLDI